ncbi:MAG: hypothetical protein Aurels2KO_47680 [Aureliella sp.]
MLNRITPTATMLLVCAANLALAQTKDRRDSGVMQASAAEKQSPALRRAAEMPVAMAGYCPVCILDMEKWVKGDPKFAVVLDGKKYLFPSEEQRQTFLKATTKYTPALSGDCIVCAVDHQVRSPGSVNFAASHKGRLFLFPDAKTKSVFMQNPAKYENADLAMNGLCVVCKIEMKQDVRGKDEFGTVYGGIRFLFPSIDQKKKFLSNPQKYLQPQSAK